MRYAILMLIAIITIAITCFYVNATVQRNPFEQNGQNTCSAQADALLKQLQVWQFKGVILSANSPYQKIWLSSQRHWIEVSTTMVPNQLLPWEIDVITTDKVIWQAKLPDYCDTSLSWTMLLNQSEKGSDSEMAYDK